jgi:hypothetical protein
VRLPLLLLSLALALPAEGSTPKRPTHAAIRKAFEQNADTLVQVTHQGRAGPGVIVSRDGHVLTSVRHVGLERAEVTVGQSTHPAQVIFADARLKLAVLKLPAEGEEGFRAPAVSPAALPRGTWLVGVLPASGKPSARTPMAGQVMTPVGDGGPFFLTSLPLPAGSPLFDARGRLVAVVVERAGKIGSRALPISAVKARLGQELAP